MCDVFVYGVVYCTCTVDCRLVVLLYTASTCARAMAFTQSPLQYYLPMGCYIIYGQQGRTVTVADALFDPDNWF